MHHEAGASIAMHPAGIQCSSDVVFTLLQHRNVVTTSQCWSDVQWTS